MKTTINPTDLISCIESHSLSKIKDFTLQDLASFVDTELNSSNDLISLCYQINCSIFKDIMSNSVFLSLPIIQHYYIEDTHYFAFDIVGHSPCQSCKNLTPIYNTLYIRDGDYGFTQLLGIHSNIVHSDYYYKIADIIPLLENRITTMDNIPFAI